MTVLVKQISPPAVFGQSASYCSCHNPACSGGAHCQDNISSRTLRRPGRADTLAWVALHQPRSGKLGMEVEIF